MVKPEIKANSPYEVQKENHGTYRVVRKADDSLMMDYYGLTLLAAERKIEMLLEWLS